MVPSPADIELKRGDLRLHLAQTSEVVFEELDDQPLLIQPGTASWNCRLTSMIAASVARATLSVSGRSSAWSGTTLPRASRRRGGVERDRRP